MTEYIKDIGRILNYKHSGIDEYIETELREYQIKRFLYLISKNLRDNSEKDKI